MCVVELLDELERRIEDGEKEAALRLLEDIKRQASACNPMDFFG